MTINGYLTDGELAQKVGRTPRRIKQWRQLGLGPDTSYIGRTPVTSIKAFEAWLAAGGTRRVRHGRKTRMRIKHAVAA